MQYKIKVGDYLKINKGFFKGSFKVLYSGMPNKVTFSLSPIFHNGYQGFSPNIFYSIDSKIITVYNKEFKVIEISPDYIIIAE
jgi:hypothetical protein